MEPIAENTGATMAEEDRATFVSKLISRMRHVYKRWAAKLGGALFDQLLFSGSNFFLNILLARWMTPEQYGAFAIAYAWFLMPENLYEAILIEPMNVFGAGKYVKQFKQYLGFIYVGHIGTSLIAALALGIGALFAYFYDSAIIAFTLAGAALASPLLLTRWLTRFPFYVLSKPHLSAFGGLIYLIVATIGYFFLHEMGWLNGPTAIIMMGVAGFVGSIFQTWRFLKPDLRFRHLELDPREVAKTHWDYGKWSMSTRVMNWIPSNVYTLLMPIFLSLAGSAALRTINNLVLPMAVAISALTSILMPSFVRAYDRGGVPALKQMMRNAVLLYAVLTGGYTLAIVLFGQPAIHILFEGKYDEYVTLPILIALGLNPLIAGIAAIIDVALRSMNNVRLSFFGKIIPTIFTLTGGVFLLAVGGLLGSYIATIIANSATIVILWWYFVRTTREVEAAEAAAMEADLDAE